ncbi:MAG: lysylphosphatidylglycerol synthase domain-containing protein [Gemmatimonadaceae bacterium]
MALSPRSRILQLLFAALATIAVWFAARDILTQWRQFRASGATLSPNWGAIVLSGAVVFVSYAVLIETWRRTVAAWGERLAWGDAARIWFVSNLGRYLPGKVWQLGAMSAMAHDKGVSPMAAAGSALVVNLINVLAGIGVVAVTGAEHLQARGAALALALVLGVGILAMPWLLPRVAALASAVLGRSLEVPLLPQRALWTAAVGCVMAWVLYGVAFRIFVQGVLGSAPGALASYIAVFTGSYLVGYIAIFAPGGIGVREKSLVSSLGRLALPPGAAGIVALTSRLWLTALEIVPGIVLLAVSAIRREKHSPREDGTKP